jgi:Trypsin-like peptidase domain
MTRFVSMVRRRTFLLGVVVLLVLSALSSVAVGAGKVPVLPGGNTGGGAVPTGAIVRVDVSGTDDQGAEASASAYGVVVDPSGLVMVPASVVDPHAPGVAVGWQWPFVGFDVNSITVKPIGASGGTAPVGPSSISYSGSVVASDGLLDVAIVKLDHVVSPTGSLTPIPAGSLNLPSVPLAGADAKAGDAVTFATYPEAGKSPVGAGKYKELTGTVSGYASDAHVPSPNVWVNTDITTPVAFPGGPIVDSSGALVGLATWLADNPSEHVFGPTASLIAPVLAAAESGAQYTSPFIVTGTGQEKADITGWGEGNDPCSTNPPLTSYPSGATQIAADIAYGGFTDGEDWYRLWFDPDQQQLIAYGSDQWTDGPAGDCISISLSSNDQAFTDGKYSLNVFAGGDLHYLGGATTTVGGGTQGSTVPVTGRVVDSDTGKGVAFAFIYLLKPGTDIQTWINGGGSDADVATSGITDDDGTYTTDPPITPGDYPYLVIPSDNHQAVGGTATVPDDGKLPDIVLTPGT